MRHERNINGARFGWRRVMLGLAVLLCGIGPHRLRADDCQAPSGLIELVRVIALLPPAGTRVGPVFAARLGDQIAGLREVAILKDLQERRLQVLSGISLELMAEGERLSHPDAPYDARHLRRMLRELDQQTELACKQAEAALKGPLPTDLAGVYTEGRVDWEDVDRKLRESKVVSGLAVLVAMLGFIAVLFSVDLLARWIWALAYNRRACRVPAVLDFGGVIVPGLVLTLGRGGFRFNPYRMEDLTLSEGENVVLDVMGEWRLEATMARRHVAMADFRLVHSLAVKRQNQILAHSTISPYYIRKSRGGGEAKVASLVALAGSEDHSGDDPAERPKTRDKSFSDKTVGSEAAATS